MRFILSLAVAVLVSVAGSAFDGAGIYRPYPGDPSVDVAAPRGYKPVYISHYGRHGSRYLEKKDQNRGVASVLEKASKKGWLTDEGKALLDDINSFHKVSDGHYGQLSPVGEAEQRAIGLRMAERFPAVFKVRGGRVECVSSTAPRCIMSLTNMTTSLKGCYPDLDFSYSCGEKYQRYIISTHYVDTVKSITAPFVESDFRRNFDFRAFSSRIFTQRANVHALVPDPTMFVRSILCNVSDVSSVGEGPDMTGHFTPEELRAASANYDVYLYGNFCNSSTGGHLRLRDAAILVRNVLDRADAALEGNGVVADIRYGHDSAMMTFLSLLGIKGYEPCVMPGDCRKIWNAADAMPMSTNLQMVFYRSRRSGDPVLVKILFNEREVSVPALGNGPFYNWEDLREYLSDRINRYSTVPA